MKKKVIVIGAGYGGLAAALDLARAGVSVEIFEADRDIGGLAGSFEFETGKYVEKFYHHWFTSDFEILKFIEELGLQNQIKRLNSNTGLFYANSIYRLTSPLDLLKFRGIPLIDRIRTGLMVLAARRTKDWFRLEGISAVDWIQKHAGNKSLNVIWRPLLKGKFGSDFELVSAVWFWNKVKLRGGSRGKGGSENLVYLEGGFNALTEAMQKALDELGVVLHKSSPVEEICVNKSCEAYAVKVLGVEHGADAILATLPLPEFLNITPALPEDYKALHSQLRFLGNICVVLRLKQSLSSTYWLNVADPSFPFVGIIEHTNFDNIENYGGEHIAYISKYLPTSDPLFAMSDEEYLEYCLPYLKQMFPKFSKDWIIGASTWRAHYSQPLVTKHYSKLIPAQKTPINSLWLSTMAQVYPEDRGTNYAIKEARRVAAEIVSELSK
ncbi:MAG: NAD(P)/FAD-dependent oxidoreductase [SAR324 cluster bacterium]|uniref:NAD(P)/FAD-dependent oxidoreductase n=1 Tax=SAR324 cluster bacterium TaxID=2024889 RepID=A0A7X9IL48_9DELT|nr:NAD(P)/FAD-dependent oxidoreductase [SAR324 cluster bacterium]